eukprot:scaffold276990_cov33-Tisochrysis_lutea.AAC.3
MASWCKCFSSSQQPRAVTAEGVPVGKLTIPPTFTSLSSEQGTPSPRALTPKRGTSLEGRWNPTSGSAASLKTTPRINEDETPAPDSARAKAKLFEEIAAANKPPEEPKSTYSWFGLFAQQKPKKSAKPKTSRFMLWNTAWNPQPVTAPAPTVNTGNNTTPATPGGDKKTESEPLKPNPDKPALVLWNTTWSPREAEAHTPKSPTKSRRSSYGPTQPIDPDSALGKAKSFEQLAQQAHASPVKKGWVEENGTFKKQKDPLPPKRDVSDLP